ncbi:MAG: hypothetical protein L0Y56_18850, partial [Nitrospira sp.]|nr:hypothetical protein [Nitrospira sp.]
MIRTAKWQKCIKTSLLILSALGWVVGVAAAETDDAGAIAAFNAIADVFASPRCTNCHAAGEAPNQDDERRPHDLNVVRGSTGRG